VSKSSSVVALAAATHPDDIEFMMAGTLLRLKDAGAEIHMWNLANGHCGTASMPAAEIMAVRAAEAAASAALAGAVSHPPLFNDLAIFYDQPSLAKAGSVLRDIRPNIILTHSPNDYMEDHQNVCRLITTAAFARGMCNFITDPPRPAWNAPVALYHALPHGLHDALGRQVTPDCWVDIAAALDRKRAMLACHQSQKEWLDASQGMNAYLNEMERMSAEVAQICGARSFAEGWRRHSALGFCPADYNPMRELLKGDYHGSSNQ